LDNRCGKRILQKAQDMTTATRLQASELIRQKIAEIDKHLADKQRVVLKHSSPILTMRDFYQTKINIK